MIPLEFTQPARPIRGEVVLPGDKSIAHRALILSAISRNKTIIKNIPFNDDVLATVNALQALGVNIKLSKNNSVVVQGSDLYGLKSPVGKIFCGESGTTFRLLLGLLAAQNFKSIVASGPALSKRPMRRVAVPLRLMGAKIKAAVKNNEEYAPLVVEPSVLHGITYSMPVASAQVKSALLLAGLYADGTTKVIENKLTRDHTERMLSLFGARIKFKRGMASVKKAAKLISPGQLYVPGDISSAAFFMVLGSIIPGARIVIKNISLNPGRVGVLKILKRMGSDIKITLNNNSAVARHEPAGDLVINYSRLKGVRVLKQEVPSLIDEIPILMVAASLARGRTIFEDVGELRVKETDRIKSMSVDLRKMGANLKTVKSGAREDVIIDGISSLKGAKVKSFGDHRTAMSMVIAGLSAKGAMRIDDVSCIAKSFPDFLKTVNLLIE